MNKSTCRWVGTILSVLFTFTITSHATNVNYYFKQISIEQGLSQGTVNCMQLDHSGVLWIGTNSGLNTFDKNELKTYLHNTNNRNSLPGNSILFLMEDMQNTLWIGTNNGLAVYNPSSNDFHRMLPAKEVVFGCLMLQDGVLFAAEGAFYRYDYTSRTLQKIPFKDNSLRFTHMSIIDEERILLTGSNAGVYLCHIPTMELRQTSSSSRSITTSCTDAKGNYYLSSYKDGIRGFSSNGRELFHLTTMNSALASDIILCMIFHQGKLWVGTDGGGISIIQPEYPQNIVTLQHNAGNRETLPNNSIKTLYVDKRQNLWAGTVRAGMFGIREVPIRTYKDTHLLSTEGISEKVVNCLYEDEEGMLWIGTDGGGINRYEVSNDRFVHYPQTFGNKIVSICSYSPHELLVSDYERGLRIFDKRTVQFRPFTILTPEVNARECFSGYAVFMDFLPPEELFIESVNTYLYNTRTHTFRQVTTEESPSHLCALRMIYADSLRIYFKGDNRLFEANRQTLVLKTIFKANENEYINSACYDGKHTFWIGTDYGLSYYDLEKKERFHIETPLFNGVSMLFLDKQQQIWVSAQNLLFSYYIPESRFTIWGESDGFTANELLSTPIASRHAPVYYMGGVSGFIKMNRNISGKDYHEPFIKLTRVTIDGTNVPNTPASIKLPHDYRSLAIRVTSEETDIFRNVLFRYTIESLNQPPIETYRYNLSLPALPPGNYTLKVSCNTKSGNWTPATSLLTIHVAAPWYRRPWVIMLAILLVILTIFTVNLYLIRKKENKLKWAMKEHEQQTYEEKIQFLINISHELRTPLTLIYAPLKRLLDQYTSPMADNEKEAKQYNILSGIYKQAKQMKNIINMVLDLNKMGQTQLSITKVPIALNEWIREVAEDFQQEFAFHRIKLEYRLDATIGNIPFEKNKCEIVLSNLLMNALKFSHSESTVTVSSDRQDNDYVRVSVSDEGIGLKGVNPRQLFNRFYQGKHSEPGTGIGLSYAQSLIELHDGHIGAFDNPEAGATFYYELPVTATQPTTETSLELPQNLMAPAVQITLSQPDECFDTHPYSILIVEDKAELNVFLKEELKELFSKVYTAPDGEKALTIIHKHTPDLIVSDIMMPCMDGFELCRRVKEDLSVSHIPLILLTARTDDSSTALGYKLGADAYLSKPFEVATLLSVIRNQLSMRQRIRKFFSKGLMDDTLIDALTTTCADESFMKQLNEIITANLNNPEMDVNFLMQQMNTSRTPLYNKVKALTGIGVNDYINNLRLQKAKELLQCTEMTITEISDTVGFTYQRYFSTLFKQTTGLSPTEYRRQKKT